MTTGWIVLAVMYGAIFLFVRVTRVRGRGK